MLIIPSKECVCLFAAQAKQIFVLDPKTTAITKKISEGVALAPAMAYSEWSQQLLCCQQSKTFLSLWDVDSSQPHFPVSLSEVMTALTASDRLLWGGTQSGNIAIWELPSGLMLKKRHLHSAEIMAIHSLPLGHLLTITKNEAKIWPMSSLLFEGDLQKPKIHHFAAPIQKCAFQGIVSAFLSDGALIVLNCEPSTPEFEIMMKVDLQCVLSVCLSPNEAFVGCSDGTIDVFALTLSLLFSAQNQREKNSFGTKEHSLGVERQKQRRKLVSGQKHGITSICFVKSLGYLVSGSSIGAVIIWEKDIPQRTLTLFKTQVSLMMVIPKPHAEATKKIKTLHKYENADPNAPIDITVSHPHTTDSADTNTIFNNLAALIDSKEEKIAARLQRLIEQKQLLINQNLMYCNKLMKSGSKPIHQ